MQYHQNYKSYSFDNRYRDIVIKEYESAEKTATSQSRLFQQLISVSFGIITLLTPFFVRLNNSSPIEKPNPFIALVLFFCFFLGILLLLYFAELQKTITINARKVVVLRKMLGLAHIKIRL